MKKPNEILQDILSEDSQLSQAVQNELAKRIKDERMNEIKKVLEDTVEQYDITKKELKTWFADWAK